MRGKGRRKKGSPSIPGEGSGFRFYEGKGGTELHPPEKDVVEKVLRSARERVSLHRVEGGCLLK